MKRALLMFALSLVTLQFLAADDTIGEIVYVEGQVIVSREDEIIEDEIDFGFYVENLDHMRAGRDGLAEVGMDPATGIDGTITVKPKTIFYFDVSAFRSNKKGSIELLAGSVAITVQKMAGVSELEVRTENAIMGVRGTTFEVSVALTGDILVACSKGSVECRDDLGNKVFAEPGRVIEKTPGEVFRKIPVAVSDLATFQREWHADKIEVFEANPGEVIESYAVRYIDLKDDFERAYDDLIAQREILNKWMREDIQGVQGGRMEIMREKRNVIGPLMDIRRVLFIFERVYYRLLEIQGYYEDGVSPRIIESGLNVEEFFAQLEGEQYELARKMSKVRYALKLYAERNEGATPFDDFTRGFDKEELKEDEEEFFGDTETFFE